MKAVLTDERFSNPEWIFERKLDGIRCVAIRDGRDRAPALAQRPAHERALSQRGGGAGRAVRRRASPWTARWWPSPAPAPASRRWPSAASGACASSTTCSTCSGSTATTCAAAAPALAQAAAARHAGVPRPAAPHAPPQRRRRGALRGGLPQGLGGPDRQAGRQPLHERALARLAEVQVRPLPGDGDRRLHRAEGLARGAGRAAARLPPRRRAALRRQGGHGVRPARRSRDLAGGCATPAPRRSAVRRRRRDQGARRHLGRAGAGGPDRLHGVDAVRPAAPSALPRAALRQGRRERWCARDDRRDSGSAAAQVRDHPPRQGALPARRG